MNPQLINGDCIEEMKKMPENSVDSIITDPPYELGFMGKSWDNTGIANDVKMWQEALRILKPGGYLLSFGGTRTYHRMACAIEDAGFEIRDMVEYLYGSGFPKSLNIGKAVDKLQGNERKEIEMTFPDGSKPRKTAGHFAVGENIPRNTKYTKGNSPYEGYGTALKPATELICMARKPLSEKTVAKNVLKWGTGGINIDGCRVESSGDHKRPFVERKTKDSGEWEDKSGICKPFQPSNKEGRFPANLILDEEAGKMLDEQSGVSKDGVAIRRHGNKAKGTFPVKIKSGSVDVGYGGKGGASRFFYCAKASKGERNAGCEGFYWLDGKPTTRDIWTQLTEENEANKDNPTFKRHNVARGNIHPTVKPLSLMRYLCTLTKTPNGGIVLDPFMGSGTTGIACINTGRDFIGIEQDKEYCKIARARLEYAMAKQKEKLL